jgi:SAM-dependent methyltransferase
MEKQQEEEEECVNEKYDAELLRTSPPPRKMFSYDWAKGFVAPFRPTSLSVLEKLCLAFRFSRDDVVLDCGCGNGSVLIELSKRFGLRAIGLDLDETLLERGRVKARESGVNHLVNFTNCNIMNVDYHSFGKISVIFLYLLPETLPVLKEKLQCLFETGTAIISVLWPIQRCEEHLCYDGGKEGFFIYKFKPVHQQQ